MATGDYNSAIVDQDSTPCGGVFTSTRGVHVKAYKNWLVIEDKKSWHKGDPRVRPVVLTVKSGDLIYKDVYIVAKRSSYQSSLYFAVWSEEEKVVGMTGICASANKGDSYCDIDDRQKDEWKQFLLTYDHTPDELRNVDITSSLNQGMDFLLTHAFEKESR